MVVKWVRSPELVKANDVKSVEEERTLSGSSNRASGDPSRWGRSARRKRPLAAYL